MKCKLIKQKNISFTTKWTAAYSVSSKYSFHMDCRIELNRSCIVIAGDATGAMRETKGWILLSVKNW